MGGTTPEIEDLTGKLTATEQLSVYRSCQAERRALEAADERRKLLARIAYLEPLYADLYAEYLESCRVVEDLEDALAEKDASMARAEKRSQSALLEAQNEATLLKGRLKAVQNDLHTIRTTTQSSAADLVAERNNAVSDLAAMQTEHQLLKERTNLLGTEAENAVKARDEAEGRLQEVKDEVAKLNKALDALKKKHTKLEADHTEAEKSYTLKISSLQSQLDESETQHQAAIKALEARHQTAIAELEARLARPSSPEKRIPHLNESLKASKAEVVTLQASLNKERKSREVAERNLTKAREEWETQHRVLETKLESLRSKYKAEKEKNAAAAAAPGSVVNPRKRAIGPVLDFEPSAKKPKPLPSAMTSEFSITPFLNRQRAAPAGDVTMASDAPSNETALNTAANSGTTTAATGAVAAAVKRFTEATVDASEEPIRPLLAGANRRKKLSKPAAPEPTEDFRVADSITDPEDDDNEVGEDSMLNIILPAKAKKRAAAARKATTTASKASEGTKRPRKPLLSESPEPEQEPSVASTIAAIPARKTKATAKPKPKKKKPAGETSFMGGIRPTLFDDDDGTGRIQLNLDDGPSQETRKLGRSAPLLAPVNAFQREISPPKKRPGGLKMKFGGK